jgi:hypothetical protein
MCGGPVRAERKVFFHKVTVAHIGAPATMPEIQVDEDRVRVILRENEVQIGCYTVSREAVEMVFELFQKHFSRATSNEIIVQ